MLPLKKFLQISANVAQNYATFCLLRVYIDYSQGGKKITNGAKHGIIEQTFSQDARAEFLAALRTLTEKEQIELWKELEKNGLIKT